jgi:hypothetical protein
MSCTNRQSQQLWSNRALLFEWNRYVRFKPQNWTTGGSPTSLTGSGGVEQHSMTVVACQWDIVYILSSLTMVDNKGLTFRQYCELVPSSFLFIDITTKSAIYTGQIYHLCIERHFWYNIQLILIYTSAHPLFCPLVYFEHTFSLLLWEFAIWIVLWFRLGLDLFQLNLSCLCGFN